MNNLTTYIVDSFTNEPFKGNPAGVCILETKLDDSLMLSIAKELGLSETAFILRSSVAEYEIRFFSPVMEIPLCGHATMAAAKVVYEQYPELETIHFTNIQHLDLKIEREKQQIVMTFPVYSTLPAEAPKALLGALGIEKVINSAFNDEMKILLVEIDDCNVLRNLNPDFEALKRSHDSINGVLITAIAENPEFDFESRYFWPWSGTNEDPVTGGTHTFLAKYWADRLKKRKMKSFQCSERTGTMEVEMLNNDWLTIKSTARIVFEGRLRI